MHKKERTYVILIIAALNIFLVRSACSKDNNKVIGRGYVMFEMNHTDIHDLNTVLERNGYSQFSENITGIGLGGHDISKNRFISEGHFSFYFPRSTNSTVGNVKYKSTLRGSLGFYNIGYLVYRKKCVTIFPLMGFGFGMMKMTINERGKHTLNEILENPRGSTIKIFLPFLLNLAMGIDRLYVIKEKESIEKGLGVGIRLGYKYSPGKPEWSNVTGNPDFFFTGPYASVTFGGGYNKNH